MPITGTSGLIKMPFMAKKKPLKHIFGQSVTSERTGDEHNLQTL
jgi:hypothetical protein